MKKNILIVVSFLLAASLLTGCAAPAVSNTAAGDVSMQRTLSVTGTGKVTLTPDIVYINIGVHTEEADVATALANNTTQSQQVADSLKQYGIEDTDIQTSAFNVYPMQNYGPQGEMLDIKYVVDNSVFVTVRDLTKLGAILNTVVTSGANNINGITFDVADRSAGESQARITAVEDAKAQAAELAEAAGAKLGKVQYMNVTSYTTPYGSYSLKGDAALANAGGSNVPVSAGQIQISVDVNITYELQ